METSQSRDSFPELLLLHRGRTGLTQRELAARARVSSRSFQDWEAGVTLPTAERLQRLIRALLEAGGLSPDHEFEEAHQLWVAAERQSARLRAPFDESWLAGLLAAYAPSRFSSASSALHTTTATEPVQPAAQDWGEAPDTTGFVGRGQELALLQHWVLDERCRLVAVLGMGGIGKTSLAARFALTVAPNFERVYWRSLRNAPPVTDWLAGAIGFLSDHELLPPESEMAQIRVLLELLRATPCLLVLDNSETLFEPGQREAAIEQAWMGMDGYSRPLVRLHTRAACSLPAARNRRSWRCSVVGYAAWSSTAWVSPTLTRCLQTSNWSATARRGSVWWTATAAMASP
jgi:transcriptional regulator with XRE-family HTH domain